MIVAFVVAHGLPWDTVDGLLRLIDALFGFNGNVLPKSKYLLRKLWSRQLNRHVKDHYYCADCGSVLDPVHGMDQVHCALFRENSRVSVLKDNGCFFSIMNVKEQLHQLISTCKEALYNELKKIEMLKRTDQIRDITSGRLYKNLRRTGARRYLETTGFARTSAGMLKDMDCALDWNVTVNGLKGPSPLVNLKHFDLVCSQAVDYMHCVLLGVARQLTEFWLDSSNSHEPFYIASRLHDFVSKAAGYYGQRFMTFNVHQLLHLAKNVENLGPLWANSAFPLETGNEKVVKMVKAAKGAPCKFWKELLLSKRWM
ncbi:hypothetical protein V5799_005547 [Amblyomma americanum]|uniref:Uncharacterized protein n=1 Tax=Amblyomma americanum TaxID=6943 RepID=A0AAQ4DYY2_AMBAM